MILSEKWYYRFKWFIIIVLPAFSSAYFALANVLGLPASEQVVGTCAIIATFLGTVLGVSDKNYNASDARFDGDMFMIEGEDGSTFRLNLKADPEVLATKDSITFKKFVETE
jgi:hypothetical protein